MLTGKFNFGWLLTSKALTAALVGSVVLINSVAWGIPLLVGAGENNRSERSSPITTAALPKPHQKKFFRMPLPEKIGPALRAGNEVPLPAKKVRAPAADNAPIPVARAASQAAEPDLEALKSAAKETLKRLESKAPATMFPRPETAPQELIARQPADTETVADDKGSPADLLGVRQPKRDVVLVSPYTPGVRVGPNGRGPDRRHQNLRVGPGPTTLETARAIARRAAERFEQMRDRMAKLSARDADLARQEKARRGVLLPVAPKPPRIAEEAGRSASKSAYNFVRPRLVRRPIGSDIVPPPSDTSRAKFVALSPALAALRPPVPQPAESQNEASAEPAARTTSRSGLLKIHRTSAARKQRRSHRRARSNRTGRRIATAGRRSHNRKRRIDGFRPAFYRQLVAANFFSNR